MRVVKATADGLKQLEWVRVFQDEAASDAHNPEIELHQRLFHLALGRMGVNNHASFRPGELRKLLTTADQRTAGKELHRATLWNAINKCVALGMLGGSSSMRCLIVPEKRAKKGAYNDSGGPCAWCDRKEAVSNKMSRRKTANQPQEIQ